MVASAATSGGESQPARTYSGRIRWVSRPSQERSQSAKATMPKKIGIITEKYPYSRISICLVWLASSAMRFHEPCRIIAVSQPAIGASTRTRLSADRAATPSPMPVIAVNSGWAKPDSAMRTTKMPMTLATPPATPARSAPAAYPYPPRYRMFSTIAKPVADSPQ